MYGSGASGSDYYSGPNGPGTPATYTPREQSQGFILDQIFAFQHMRKLGADFMDAFVACISGNRMTPDLAALCIATYWRRYCCIAHLQESRGAAITLQASAGRPPACPSGRAARSPCRARPLACTGG
jgi:hypothetical protein